MAASGRVGENWSYRAHLDGLRSVAVYLVVAFHAGIGRLSGGFIGVDVFFVLSGYLVTGVLLRGMESGERFSLATFYARRVRRLLPAASVTLVVTLLVYAAVADTVSTGSALDAGRAAFVYLTNWFFIREASDYFATDSDANPLLHFWSLAVEEQFYVVWPVALLGLRAASRRLPGEATRWLQAVVVVGIVASVGLALAWRATRPDRAYFGTDTRAYQLLAGALLALAPGIVARLSRWSRPADAFAAGSAVALVVAGSSLWSGSAIVRGIAATALTVGLIAGVEASPRGYTARAAGVRPMAYLGRISYGTYLWHWPVLVVLREVWPMSSRSQFVASAVLATSIAALSYELLEQPVRTWSRLDRWPVPVAMSGLAVGIAAAVIVVPGLPEGGRRVVRTETAAGADSAYVESLTPVPDDFSHGDIWYANDPDYVKCSGGPATACTVRQGRGPHLAIMGDSTVHAILSGFEAMADRYDLTLTLGTRPGCPWPRGHYVLEERIQEECRALKEDFYERVLPELRPDAVLVLDAGPNADVDQRDPAESRGSTEYREAVLDSVPQILASAERLVMIEPLPKIAPLANPLDCLRHASYVEQCRFQAAQGRNWMEDLYAEVADANPGATTLDLDRLACPTLPTCEAVIDGTVVWWDGQHITTAFAATWADALYRELAAIGVVPPVGPR